MRLRLVVLMVLVIMAIYQGYEAFATPGLKLEATVSSINGKVEVLKVGEKDWITVEKGTKLFSGDAIRTGPEGECVLIWGNGNILKMMPLTEVTLDNLEVTPVEDMEISILSLQKGRTYILAKRLVGIESKFSINTPTAVAEVRGTRFSADVASDGTTILECIQGELSVSGIQGGEVSLKEGYKTTVAKGQVPGDPLSMNPTEIETFESIGAVNVPLLVVIEPMGDLETESPVIMVHGRTEQANTITVNGTSVNVSEPGFFSFVEDLVPGENQLKVEAKNKRGSSTSKEYTIIYNTKKGFPGEDAFVDGYFGKSEVELDRGQIVDLVIIYPPDGFLTRKTQVMVIGKKSKGAKLTINGDSEGFKPGVEGFMKRVALDDEGENIIVLKASRGKASKTIKLRIIKDTIPPVLEIIKPITGQFDIMTGDCVLRNSGIADCNLVGFTEPDATLLINNIRHEVEIDGSFNTEVALDPRKPVILVSAEDIAGNRTTKILTRTLRDIEEIIYLTVTPNPDTIVADNVSTATITVTGKNYLAQPVDGVTVSLSSSAGGTLSSTGVVLTDGVGTMTFTAGIGAVRNTVTITATSGAVSESTSLLLLPDFPEDPED